MSDARVSNRSRSGWYNVEVEWPISRIFSAEDGKRVEGGEAVFRYVKGEEGNEE